MAILWLIIGFIAGLLVAWFYLDKRYRDQSAESEAKLRQDSRQAEEALERERDAHNATGQRVSELEVQHTSARQQSASLTADLQTSQKQLQQVKAGGGGDNARVASLQGRVKQQDEQIMRLETDLAECRKKASSTTSRPATGSAGDTGGGTTPAPPASSPSSGRPASGAPATGTAGGAGGGPGGGTTPAHAASSPASGGPASGAADDLTKIKGIGQVLKGKLNQLGITTFKQIAEFTPADMDRVNAVLDVPGRIERERWVDQAKEFVRQQS